MGTSIFFQSQFYANDRFLNIIRKVLIPEIAQKKRKRYPNKFGSNTIDFEEYSKFVIWTTNEESATFSEMGTSIFVQSQFYATLGDKQPPISMKL